MFWPLEVAESPSGQIGVAPRAMGVVWAPPKLALWLGQNGGGRPPSYGPKPKLLLFFHKKI
jgi:hypothetical protein